jgi:hypothetical protein
MAYLTSRAARDTQHAAGVLHVIRQLAENTPRHALRVTLNVHSNSLILFRNPFNYK